jgi:uncharacterized Zn finger protein
MTYLKDRQHYEDRYDRTTVESCRRGERIVNQTFKETEKRLPANELKQRHSGWYLQYSVFYFSLVELPAALRAKDREETIAKWMAHDEDKDLRLAKAQIPSGTYCHSCGRDMRIISKDYMSREGQTDDDILIMLECESCHKRQAVWQDGAVWEGAKIRCDKCGSPVKSVYKAKGKVVTTIMTCTKCGHIKTDSMDLSKDTAVTEKSADPHYELDRKRFVFDNDMVFKCQQKAVHLKRLQNLHAKAADKAEHVDVYEAIKDIKKLKIAQLGGLLAPSLAKRQYNDFKLGEPQMGREVSLDFGCLDADAEREEYQSVKNLKKLIEKLLIDTNWRLMSDGISYRLGHLSGRLRAYESEEDLKKLVEQRIKSGKAPMKLAKAPEPDKKPELDIREAAQVYMDKMTLGSVPAEITLKSGIKKPHSIPVIRAEMNPLLRVFIPMRDGDETVPDFIRNYDFKMGKDDGAIPKVSKDSLGRTNKTFLY